MEPKITDKYSHIPDGHEGWEPGEVFSINFVRQEVLPAGQRRIMNAIVLGSFAVQAVVMAMLVGWGILLLTQQGVLKKYQAEQLGPGADISQFREEIKNLQGRADKALEELQTAVGLEKDRFRATLRLAALVQTLPPRTWIVSIRGWRENSKCEIRSRSVVNPEEPYKLPATGWVEKLRNDPIFGKNLKSIEIINPSQFRSGGSELYEFTIQAAW